MLSSIVDTIHISSLEGYQDYPETIIQMEQSVQAIRDKSSPERIWFLEHPSLYTAGTSAKEKDLLVTDQYPIYKTGRGGQYTHHGPGQLIIYVMLDLHKRKFGVREFVKFLEKWVIQSLDHIQVPSFLRDGRVGVWTYGQNQQEEKIAALGIRIRKGISYHGIAVNLAPNLQNYRGIVPCGLSNYGVTSLETLGKMTTRKLFEKIMISTLRTILSSEEI